MRIIRDSFLRTSEKRLVYRIKSNQKSKQSDVRCNKEKHDEFMLRDGAFDQGPPDSDRRIAWPGDLTFCESCTAKVSMAGESFFSSIKPSKQRS